jgi:7-carboxy-7-deazaguanine synthase
MAGLQVIEIFDSLQGEGFWTGVPMTFVRLAGCNAPALGLACVRWCDTPGSWTAESGAEMETAEILERVHLPRMCLTGGEPLLQTEGVVALVAEARRRGIKVHLETNGTVEPPPAAGPAPAAVRPGSPEEAQVCGDTPFAWAVVSPKPPDYFIAPGWDGFVDELKLVADERLEAATAERLATGHPGAIVCIQPVWERGPGPEGRRPPEDRRPPGDASVERAVRLVMEHPGWRLSLQTHKYLGIR